MENFESLKEKIHSFDATVSVYGRIQRPDRHRDLFKCLSQGPFVPRGAGSSYALASAGEGVTSVLSEKFNRLLSFDEQKGILTAEAGVSLGVVLRFLSEKKWWLSAIPGHPNITLGGAIAFQVHGKNQYRDGCLGDQVLSISLYHPKHGLIEASREKNREVLDLTIGGMGLTGFIVAITIQCEKLKGNAIQRTRINVSNLGQAAEVLQQKKDSCDLVYSWNNFNLKDANFGRGFVFTEEYVQVDSKKFQGFCNLTPPAKRTGWESRISPLVRNHLGTFYEISERLKPATSTYELLQGTFPINGKEIYHRLFGTKGLLENQFIISIADWKSVSRELQTLFCHHKVSTTLGSLKLFGGHQKFLCFQGEGYCLSFDMPYSPVAVRFFEEVDQLLVKYRCTPSIAKDSRLPGEVIKKTYVEYEYFRRSLRDFDPDAVVQSHLRARLGL